LNFSQNGVQKMNTNYMVAKGGMTLAAMFGALEFGAQGIGFNTLWPTGLVTTSALNHLFRYGCPV
jgi:NAD(P)-dependent dehydrogenase (short-subunit alcohol dehydrogenase family)